MKQAVVKAGGQRIEVDIRTRVVQPDDQIFIVFPGERHAFYPHMINRGVVYLDLPGLDLSNAKSFADIADINARLALSDKIRIWHNKKRPLDEVPSRLIRDYHRAGETDRRALLAGSVERLYFGLKPGDLVVVPGPTNIGDVYVGEIVGKLTSVKADKAYPDETIPARRVRWLGHVPKYQFSTDMVARLGLPNYLVQLDKSLWNEVLRVAYDNYVHDGLFVTKFKTLEHSFSTLDEYNIQSFINFVAGALTAGRDGVKNTTLDLDSALEILEQHPDLVPSLKVNINSPGSLSVFDDWLLPVALAAAIAIATSGHAEAKPDKIDFVNSAAPPADRCAVDVGAAIKDAFTLMNYETWKKSCYRLQDAQKRTGVSTAVKVEGSPAAPKRAPK